MRFDIIKKINEEKEREKNSVQIPLQIPVPELDDFYEEVSVISNIIEIDLNG